LFDVEIFMRMRNIYGLEETKKWCESHWIDGFIWMVQNYHLEIHLKLFSKLVK
jgi:hypothetical protein